MGAVSAIDLWAHIEAVSSSVKTRTFGLPPSGRARSKYSANSTNFRRNSACFGSVALGPSMMPLWNPKRFSISSLPRKGIVLLLRNLTGDYLELGIGLRVQRMGGSFGVHRDLNGLEAIHRLTYEQITG